MIPGATQNQRQMCCRAVAEFAAPHGPGDHRFDRVHHLADEFAVMKRRNNGEPWSLRNNDPHDGAEITFADLPLVVSDRDNQGTAVASTVSR